MGQALYRKHRPKSLKQVVGQEHITQTLEKALKQGRISHAYLFTGPRGVGKTSIARILAHEINGLPYEDDSAHMDIIEIDAASNRRIDEIRELRDKVYVAPTSAKYKVYIIDEVHMLTREAFNALLKTLEEPPAHVVFILATTDAHKLPETIISRTQRFSFKPVARDQVVAHLADLAKQEGIKIDKEALGLLAEHGEGSFRDSISLLDQAGSHGQELKLDDVQRLLGIPPTQSVEALLRSLEQADSAGVVSQLESMYGQGYQAAVIAKQVGQILRSQLIDDNLAIDSAIVGELLKQLIEVPIAHNPDRFLEISLLQAIPPSSTSISRPVDLVDKPAKQADSGVNEPSPVPVIETEPEAIPEPIITEAKESPVSGTATLDAAIWPQVLGALKARHNTLYGVVRMAQADFTDDGVRLTFAFAFHQKRISDSASRKLLTDIIKELTGQSVTIECLLDKNVKTAPAQDLPVISAQPKPQQTGELAAISNIFGGGELLES